MLSIRNLPILTVGLLLVMAAGCICPISIARLRRPDLSVYTSPLNTETIQDICQQFHLTGDRRCQEDQTVYAPDFFPDILPAFERGVSTRDDVRAKLGVYEYDCEQPIYVPSLNRTYYTCSYDLRGDRVYPIGVFYDIEDSKEIVSGIVATIVDD
jgi:hypothetical protein